MSRTNQKKRTCRFCDDLMRLLAELVRRHHLSKHNPTFKVDGLNIERRRK